MKKLLLTLIMMMTGVILMNAQRCNRCGDSGKITEKCLQCHGTGKGGCNYCNGGYKMCTMCMKEGSLECSTCDGSGKVGEDDDCPDCSGRGRVICNRCSGDGVVMCESCSGTGGKECYNCHGNGYKEWRCPDCIAAGRI